MSKQSPNLHPFSMVKNSDINYGLYLYTTFIKGYFPAVIGLIISWPEDVVVVQQFRSKVARNSILAKFNHRARLIDISKITLENASNSYGRMTFVQLDFKSDLEWLNYIKSIPHFSSITSYRVSSFCGGVLNDFVCLSSHPLYPLI